MARKRKTNFKSYIIPEINKFIPKSRKLREHIKKLVKEEFLKIQKVFLKKFDEHPITKEIKIGPTATNKSGTLSGRSGNLFGFIGFPKGSSPIPKLRKILEEYRIKIYSRAGRTYVSVYVPTKEEVFQKTPMPWASGDRSWVKSIESGIPGLSRYLAFKTVKSKSGAKMRIIRKRFSSPYPSRSGGGIQVKTQIKQSRYIPKKYMSNLFSEYRKDIMKLRRGKVF